jgi:hypothetical protein
VKASACSVNPGALEGRALAQAIDAVAEELKPRVVG